MRSGIRLAIFAVLIGAGTHPLIAQRAADGSTASELAAPVRLRAGDGFIDSGAHRGYSGPLVCDFDGDEKLDLLVGSFRGHIQVYRNIGTSTEPVFEDQGLLQAEGKEIKIHNW